MDYWTKMYEEAAEVSRERHKGNTAAPPRYSGESLVQEMRSLTNHPDMTPKMHRQRANILWYVGTQMYNDMGRAYSGYLFNEAARGGAMQEVVRTVIQPVIYSSTDRKEAAFQMRADMVRRLTDLRKQRRSLRSHQVAEGILKGLGDVFAHERTPAEYTARGGLLTELLVSVTENMVLRQSPNGGQTASTVEYLSYALEAVGQRNPELARRVATMGIQKVMALPDAERATNIIVLGRTLSPGLLASAATSLTDQQRQEVVRVARTIEWNEGLRNTLLALCGA